MMSQIFAAFAVLAALLSPAQKAPKTSSDAAPREGADEGSDEEQITCTECRLTFMKCVTAGAGLPPDARKERKRECADAAAKCFERCTRGDVMTEYLVVVGVLAIVVAGAIASLGIPMLTGYGAARQVLIAPTP